MSAEVRPRLYEAVRKAKAAFWKELGKAFPEVAKPNLPTLAGDRLNESMLDAGFAWARVNQDRMSHDKERSA